MFVPPHLQRDYAFAIVTCKQRNKWVKKNAVHVQTFKKLCEQYHAIRDACPTVASGAGLVVFAVNKAEPCCILDFPVVPDGALLSQEHLWDGSFKGELQIHNKYKMWQQYKRELELLQTEVESYAAYYKTKLATIDQCIVQLRELQATGMTAHMVQGQCSIIDTLFNELDNSKYELTKQQFVDSKDMHTLTRGMVAALDWSRRQVLSQLAVCANTFHNDPDLIDPDLYDTIFELNDEVVHQGGSV